MKRRYLIVCRKHASVFQFLFQYLQLVQLSFSRVPTTLSSGGYEHHFLKVHFRIGEFREDSVAAVADTFVRTVLPLSPSMLEKA